jgi:hypothetical protein
MHSILAAEPMAISRSGQSSFLESAMRGYSGMRTNEAESQRLMLLGPCTEIAEQLQIKIAFVRLRGGAGQCAGVGK